MRIGHVVRSSELGHDSNPVPKEAALKAVFEHLCKKQAMSPALRGELEGKCYSLWPLSLSSPLEISSSFAAAKHPCCEVRLRRGERTL
jgi:hypothetical protein